MPVPESFDFALKQTELFITVATGVLAFSATFSSPKEGRSAPLSRLLIASWCFLLLSICFGLVSIMAITGTIADGDAVELGDINKVKIIIPAIAQVFSFLLGLTSLVISSILRFSRNQKPDIPPQAIS